MKTITKLRILYPLWAIVGTFSLLYAANLPSDSIIFKIGQVGQILVQLFQIAVALLLYKLFEKTDKTNALMIVVFGLLAVPLSLMGILFPDAIHLAEIFWGLWLIPIGTLAIKSRMFPKWIGYCLYIGALGYLGGVISFFLIGSIPDYIEVLTMGEVIWLLWITIRGAKEK